MNWKEQFDKEFRGHIIMEDTALRNWIHQTIENKVIKKLIADIPDFIPDSSSTEPFGKRDISHLKQQLKDKWLGTPVLATPPTNREYSNYPNGVSNTKWNKFD